MEAIDKNKYISKIEAVRILQKAYTEGRIKANDGCVSLLDDINGMPAADVQPVKHGRWIITDDVEHFIAVCSECGRTEDSRDIKDMPYCHCGARMDLKDGDTE